MLCVWRRLLMVHLAALLGAATSSPAPRLSHFLFQPPSPPSPSPSVSRPPSLSSPSPSSASLIPPDVSSREGCTLVISPSELVVRFGDPLVANCSVETTDFMTFGWQVGPDTVQGMTMDRFQPLGLDRITTWGLQPMCFALMDHEGTCSRQLHLTVYKPPDNVSIGLVDHSGPLLEGHRYSLQCLVQDVAPVQNLTVTFYRGDIALGSAQYSINPVETPVTETFNISIISSREDDGVQYWCEAVLDLGPHGPQPAPVTLSQKLKAMVYYGPHLLCPKKLHLGEGGALGWEVSGHPQPLVTWSRDGQVVAPPTHPSQVQPGNYTVSAKGALGWLNCTMEVDSLRGKGTSNTDRRHVVLRALLLSGQVIYWVSKHSM